MKVPVTLEVSSRQLGMPFNVRLDGGASGSPASTTGHIEAGSRVLTLAEPLDFADGQGLYLANGGPLSSLDTPPAPVLSQNGPQGMEQYSYVVVALDGLGGGSAASEPATLNTGPATLGGLGPDGSGQNAPLYEARWINIRLAPVEGANGGYAVYRVKAPATSQLALGFLGIIFEINAPFIDYGQTPDTPPPGIPAAPPSFPFAQGLVTTIISGGGSSTLMLADAAVTTVDGGPVYHDDSEALARAYERGGAVIYHPPGTYRVSRMLTFAVPDGILEGDGGASQICYQANYTASLVVTQSHVNVRNLAINGAYVGCTLLSIRGADDVTIREVSLANALQSGLEAEAFTMTSAHRLSVTGNTVQNCATAISVLGNWDNVLIAENIVHFDDYNHSGRGVSLHNIETNGTYLYPTHWIVTENRIRAGNHTGGIVVQGAGLGTITSNVLEVAGGIFGMAFYANPVAPASSSGVVCSANYCESLWIGAGNGVYIDGYAHITVAENILRNWGYAIQVTGYGGPAESPDVTTLGVVAVNNNIDNAVLGPVNGSLPLAVELRANSGLNPLGIVSQSPPASGVSYQNPYPTSIQIYQPLAIVDPSSEASVDVNMGRTDATLTPVYHYAVPAYATTTNPVTVSLRVPYGWWYGWTATNVQLLTPVIVAD
ncbi:MAG: right-handed parallel beta-helix repeat-containing protein [Firmicutes bacterium]|nr:right-handed parallel beta-helix repeat-containing protein [Bacillota bacterium]